MAQITTYFTSSSGGGISGSGAAGEVQFNNAGAFGASSNLFWDNTNSRLGVGTSTPSAPISGLNNGASTSGAIFFRGTNTGITDGAFAALENAGITATTNLRLGGFLFAGLRASSTSNFSALIAGFASENWSQTAAGSYLTFETVANGTISRLERMRINQDGNVLIGSPTSNARLMVLSAGSTSTTWTAQFQNSAGNSNTLMIRDDGKVGIGTATPEGRIHVTYSNFSDVAILERSPSFTTSLAGSAILRASYSSSPSDGAGPSFSFQIKSGSTVNDIASFGAARDGVDNSGAIVFSTFKSGAQSERARINSDGNFSIGVVAATARLHVRGSGNSSTTSAVLVQNSDSAELFRIKNDGAITGNLINEINVKTASYTLALSDANKIVEMNVATTNTLTVPENTTANFPIGTNITIIQANAGQTTITPVNGTVVIQSANGWTKINTQYGAVTLVKKDANTWYLFGNLNA
jgi:hypothetical protein